MDKTIIQELTTIFPNVDGVTIRNSVNKAERLSDGNLANILPISIDLVLSDQQQERQKYGQSETTQQRTNGPPNDDIIYVGKINKDKSITCVDDRNAFGNDVYINEERSSINMNRPTDVTPVSYSTDSRVLQTGQGSNLLEQVTQVFPTVNVSRVNELIGTGHDLNTIVNHLLEHPEFCKPLQRVTTTTPVVPSSSPSPPPSIDYYKNYSLPVSVDYSAQCLSLLKNDFRMLYVADIRTAAQKFRGHYAATRKYLKERLSMSGYYSCRSSPNESSSSLEGTPPRTPNNTLPKLNILGKKRHCVTLPLQLDPELVKEIQFVRQQKKLEEEQKNKIYAQHINEKQYEEEGQSIECGCCYGEFPFEEVVQCTDAHLFCCDCLRSYSKEVIFGSAISTAELLCMTSGCTKTFPYNQLAKVLSEEEIVKYQERLQEDCLVKVDMPDLVKCPFCEFKAIVPEGEKVFTCMKPGCGKMTCKDCGEEWQEHIGLRCNEVEKKCQTDLRVSYEEKMTSAKIRICAKCSCQFTKSDGCNKMTCRCGQTMCYLCRKPGIHYDHFCRHPREPGKKCKQCTSCSLWTDPTEDEKMALEQLEKEAQTAKRKLVDDLYPSEKRQKL